MNSVDELMVYLSNFPVAKERPDIAAVNQRAADCLEAWPLPYECVHVAGTNGKGSVCAYLESILRTAGYRTGLFISPYLERFNERIQVNGACISDEDLMRWANRISCKIRDRKDKMSVSQFEFVTLMALGYFAEQQVDIAVIEVGLGGRLDPTNVILPQVGVITTIGMDHLKFLGSTLVEIAKEKAGIIKSGMEVISLPQRKEVQEVLRQQAECVGAKLQMMNEKDVKILASGERGVRFVAPGGLGEASVRLCGEHQAYNASGAILASLAMRKLGKHITAGDIRKGLDETKWPGRLELIGGRPSIWLDGAHNEDAARRLCEAMEKFKQDKNIVLIAGVMKDKAVEKMAPYWRFANKWVFTKPKNDRALTSRELYEKVGAPHPPLLTENFEEAMKLAIRICPEDGWIVISGSLYLVGEARKYLLKKL